MYVLYDPYPQVYSESSGGRPLEGCLCPWNLVDFYYCDLVRCLSDLHLHTYAAALSQPKPDNVNGDSNMASNTPDYTVGFKVIRKKDILGKGR